MHKNHAFTRLWHSGPVRDARRLASPRRWYRYLTADWRPLPDVIIAGAQKAGTTSLFGYLAGHPLCLRPITKEVNFFDQNYARGQRWYRMHFPYGRTGSSAERTLPSGAFCVEASPHYMFEPEVAGRVRELQPAMKAIFLLRDPVSRAYSHYQHQVRRGRETRPFAECVAAESRATGRHSAATNGNGSANQSRGYLARGLYAEQLLNWREHFPAEQMLVLEAERMFRNPQEVFAEVMQFLGLSAWQPVEFANLNPGGYRVPMNDAARDLARRYFAPHNERLFELLGQRYVWG
jgi:hypothetical protein